MIENKVSGLGWHLDGVEVVNLPHFKQEVCFMQSPGFTDWAGLVAAETALTGWACAEVTCAGAAKATVGVPDFVVSGAKFDVGALGSLALRSSGKLCTPRNEQSNVRRMRDCTACMINSD